MLRRRLLRRDDVWVRAIAGRLGVVDGQEVWWLRNRCRKRSGALATGSSMVVVVVVVVVVVLVSGEWGMGNGGG
jgi:hypothetical protein